MAVGRSYIRHVCIQGHAHDSFTASIVTAVLPLSGGSVYGMSADKLLGDIALYNTVYRTYSYYYI